MARTLFFGMMLRKFSEITNNKPIFTLKKFFVFFTIINIFFFNLGFYLFLIIAREVNQIRNNVVRVVKDSKLSNILGVVVGFVFVFCCALTTGRCNAFHHIFVN